MATYNLLNYPGTDGTARHPYFRTVLRALDPDVLVVQEMGTAAGVSQFRDQVLNPVSASPYTSAPFNDGPDSDNALFYRADRVVFLGAAYITNTPRRIAEYRLLPAGTSDTLRLYSLHFKANLEDSLARLTEATVLRNHLNNLPAAARFILGGDYNIYRSTEPAFLKLTGSEPDNDGRAVDPLHAVGTWNENYTFRAIHTQSTRRRSFGDGATGGLDDRFDMLLLSTAMEPLLISSTYHAYGNDGAHFNDSINEPPNLAVPDSVADALHYASDHLPVVAEFLVGSSAPDTGFTSIASGTWSTPGIWSGGVVPSATSGITIGAGTVVTVDAAAVCASVGVSGVLQFDATDGRMLTVTGDLDVRTGGELRASAPFASGSATQTLVLGGDLVLDGGFSARVTGSSSGSRVLNVTFNGAGPSVIDGSSSAVFNVLRMDLTSPGVTLTPLIPLTFASSTSNALALARGTWVQSTASTTTPSVNITVDSAAVLAVGDAGAFGTGAASLLVRGALEVTGGTVTVGAGNNRLEVLAGGSLTVAGGTVAVHGRLTLTGGTTDISAGAVDLNPRGTTPLAATSTVLELGSQAAVSMTGGSIRILNPRTATGSGREIRALAGPGAKSLPGGMITLGQGASTLQGSDSGFVVESSVPLPRLHVVTGGGAGRSVTLAADLTVSGLHLESGDLRPGGVFAPGFDLHIAGSLRRTDGAIAAEGREVRLLQSAGGTPDTIGSGFTGPAAIEQLVIAGAAGALLEGDLEIRTSLDLVGGSLATGSHTVILDTAALLQEQEGRTIAGRVRTTRMVAQGEPAAFGGMGFEVTVSGAAPGLTTVERSTGLPVSSGFSFSIARVFRVTPAVNTGLDAQVRFRYDGTELNGQEERTLALWASADSGATWTLQASTHDTLLNVLDADTAGTLAWFTASDSANPLRLHEVVVDLRTGWSMVSLPVGTPCDSVVQVFPASRSAAFAFTSAGYQQHQRLLRGRGYWVKHDTDTTAQVAGFPVTSDSIPVAAGWNLIGTVSYPVDTSAVAVIPSGNRRSDYIGFGGLYSPADTLVPGKAYWVKFGEPGTVVLTVSPLRRR